MKKILLSVDGETVSLRKWASLNGASYDVVRSRWNDGERDPDELVRGYASFGPINSSEIEWLKKTRWARKGQADEWLIACDLIGQPRIRAKEIRRLVEG